MKKTTLKKYAKLLVESGIQVKKGDIVIIDAGLDQPEFVSMCVETCYRAGAAKVMVEWRYQPLEKFHVRYQSSKILGTVEDYEKAKWQYRVDKLPSRLFLLSDDPNGLKGINQDKLSQAQQARFKVIEPYRNAMDNRYKWCIASVPGVAWAKKVFPKERTSCAVEKLWKAILYTSRVIDSQGNDLEPTVEWYRHNLNFKKRCKALNDLHIQALKYHASNGTNFYVGLMPESRFLGGSDRILSGDEFFANIPTEEVYTTPMKGVAEGIVHASMPLSYRGELIEDFWLRFENGRVIEVGARKNEALLKPLISMDDGASMLGECALVPQSSPICQSGILFYETLFDENASCHLALGEGYTCCVQNFEQYSYDQLHEMGVNDSMVHVDFMIGTDDMCITAITNQNEEVIIFQDGNWAI